MGKSQAGGHDHCHYPDSQLPELRAFVEKFLTGNGDVNSRVMKTDGEIESVG